MALININVSNEYLLFNYAWISLIYFYKTKLFMSLHEYIKRTKKCDFQWCAGIGKFHRYAHPLIEVNKNLLSFNFDLRLVLINF